jgi:hypothetical protein
MKRILHIPREEIAKIFLIVENEPNEYGGWVVYDSKALFKSIKQFKGNKLEVSVPTENYELHWHTHPAFLIDDESYEQTGTFQPPSINDIAQSSYKYYSTDFFMGTMLRQIVFTKHGIYIQEPIEKTLENWFKTKDFLISNKKNNITWINKWYKPFKKEAEKIRKSISNYGLDYSYTDDDTGKKITLQNEELREYNEVCNNLEKEYFSVCKKYGVKVTKIVNIQQVKNKGLDITI